MDGLSIRMPGTSGNATSAPRQQVTAQERELVAHDCLMWRSVVDVEVVDARVDAQLSQRCSTCRCYRGARLGYLVGLAHADEPRAVQPCRQASRLVRGAEEPTR